TLATSTNNLRKHYASKHPKLILNTTEGRPTTVEETVAIAFYTAIRDAYDARIAAAVEAAALNKPAIPRCCRAENATRCDNFEYFDSDDQSEVSDPPEEESNE
ncbi:hypothetical protein PENSOL_c073G00220, partial [Penicillium solitum]